MARTDTEAVITKIMMAPPATRINATDFEALASVVNETADILEFTGRAYIAATLRMVLAEARRARANEGTS